MAPPPLSWLFRLAVLCHLTMLLTGQQHGMKKCDFECNTMHPEIPLNRLKNYRRSAPSCHKQAIIFETIRHKFYCADPEAEWVQEAMKHLDCKTTPISNDGIFDMRKADTTRAASGMDGSTVPEPKATGESSNQQTQRALKTSPELPTSVAGSWRPTYPTTSKSLDGQPPAGPETTKLYNSAAITITTSWQSSAAYQPGSVLWTERKASEITSAQAPSAQALPLHAPSTQTPPTQTPSTQTPSTQTPSTQTLSTQTLSTQAPSTQTPSTHTLPIQTLPTQTPSTQTPSTQIPSTQTPSTQAPSTQTPIISYTAPADSTGPDVWTSRQNPMPMYSSLEPKKTDPISTPTDDFMGPSSMPHVPVVPVSPEEPTSRAVGASDSHREATEGERHQSPGVSDSQVATRRQAIGLLAFLGLLFCLGVAMFAYQSLQACHLAGNMVEGLRYVPRNCGSNSYVLVPV